MKKVIFIVYTLCFWYASGNLYENNEKINARMEQLEKEKKEDLNKIDKKINDKKTQTILSLGKTILSLIFDDSKKLTFHTIAAENDLKELNKAIEDRYETSKELEKRKEMHEIIKEYENEILMQDYFENHNGDTSSSDTDKVGGLRE